MSHECGLTVELNAFVCGEGNKCLGEESEKDRMLLTCTRPRTAHICARARTAPAALHPHGNTCADMNKEYPPDDLAVGRESFEIYNEAQLREGEIFELPRPGRNTKAKARLNLCATSDVEELRPEVTGFARQLASIVCR